MNCENCGRGDVLPPSHDDSDSVCVDCGHVQGDQGHRTVTRYIITHIGRGGKRIMTAPARQARYTYASVVDAGEAMKALLDMASNGNDIAGVFGVQAVGTFKVRPVECWASNYDPIGVPEWDD